MAPNQGFKGTGASQPLVLRLEVDGLPADDVKHSTADEAQLRSYALASDELSKFKAPILFDRADPHSHLIFALMDGTGSDIEQDRLHSTNVVKLLEQANGVRLKGVSQIHAVYTPGPATQSGLIEMTIDGALGQTSLQRAESTYLSLVKQAQHIFRADPNAKVALHLEGFSRGASQVPLLARIIDERGIPDLSSERRLHYASGQFRDRYTRYHQSPGQTLISVGLYDPVPTGYMELLDRRLPPSVVSGFQISAAHERRSVFPSDQILPMGSSADGRFLHVSVAGSHSDVGGGYLRDGLAVRSLNLMTDYHNSLLSEPLFPRIHEPLDPRINVVHHSEQSSPLFRYGRKVGRADAAGQVHRLSADTSWHTPQGEVVHLPAQAVEPMRADLENAITARQSVVKRAASPPSLSSHGDGLLQRLREAGVELLPYRVPIHERPPVRIAALGTLGAAASVYDAAETGQRMGLLYGQGNPDAAQSELARYMGRGVGGWSGGAAAGAAVGGVTGPGAMPFIAYGALIGGTVGGELAERWDQHRTFNQTDHEKVDWKFDGRQWTREELADLSGVADSTGTDGNSGAETAAARPQRFAASMEKASELNYLASNMAASLAMGDAPTPMDPYRLPATSADRPSLREADWEQDPKTYQWSRKVATAYLERGVPQYQHDLATAQRSAELDALSRQVVDTNISQSSAAIAARYEAVYAAQDWQRHGPLPTAIQTSLDSDALAASDGRHYQRTADGAWRSGDRMAEGNLRRELDETLAALQPALGEHRTHVASIQPPAPFNAQQQERAELAATYLQHGVQPRPETLDAALEAVAKTRHAYGIAPGTTSLALEPRWDGKWDVDSPIAHLARIDGVVHKVAVTTTAELHEARDAHKHVAAPNTPIQSGHPDHALYQQVRDGVSALDAHHGRDFDAASERMTASLLVLAKQQGLTRVDHVLLSAGTAETPAGQNLFVVQGELAGATQLRASMPTVQAAQTPVDESMQRFEVMSQQQDQRAQQMHDEQVQQESHGRLLRAG